MKIWEIKIKLLEENNKETKLELIDAFSYFGGYLKIKRSFFNELMKSIKISKNYLSKRAIENVLDIKKNEDWTNNPWILIIAKEMEKNMPFWFLLKREKDLSGLLIAIGPDLFAQYNNKQDVSEARREIKRILNYIISYINKFQCLILLPNYLK